MTIAAYRQAKKVLADFDAFMGRAQKAKDTPAIEARVIFTVPNATGGAYPDKITDPGLNERAGKLMAQAAFQIASEHRTALVERIATLHRQACLEAAAVISEEPPQ